MTNKTAPGRDVMPSVDTNVDTIRPMAREPKTQRQYRSSDSVYDAAMAESKRRGEYLSEAINQFLVDYANRKDANAPTSR